MREVADTTEATLSWSCSHQIDQYKSKIKCIFCGNSDANKDYILRIPQQCSAGTEGECDWDGSGKLQVYSDLKQGGFCVKGMHVGCARWSQPNPRNLQHVFWFPNGHKEANIYCQKVCKAAGVVPTGI
jgi:hypothetical protein